MFAEEKDGRYTRADEEQTERCYSRETLTAALEKAGFADVCFFGDTDLGAPHAETERWFIAARCKKKEDTL